MVRGKELAIADAFAEEKAGAAVRVGLQESGWGVVAEVGADHQSGASGGTSGGVGGDARDNLGVAVPGLIHEETFVWSAAKTVAVAASQESAIGGDHAAGVDDCAKSAGEPGRGQLRQAVGEFECGQAGGEVDG